jgi:hypothetical protein
VTGRRLVVGEKVDERAKVNEEVYIGLEEVLVLD